MLQCGKGGDAYSRLPFIEPPPCHPLSSWKGAAQKHEDPGSTVLYNIGHQRPLNISGSLKPERGGTTEVLSSGGESDDDTQSEGSISVVNHTFPNGQVSEAPQADRAGHPPESDIPRRRR